MAEQADARDSKSRTLGYVGSIPTFGTKKPLQQKGLLLFTLSPRLSGDIVFALTLPDPAVIDLADLPSCRAEHFSTGLGHACRSESFANVGG